MRGSLQKISHLQKVIEVSLLQESTLYTDSLKRAGQAAAGAAEQPRGEGAGALLSVLLVPQPWRARILAACLPVGRAKQRKKRRESNTVLPPQTWQKRRARLITLSLRPENCTVPELLKAFNQPHPPVGQPYLPPAVVWTQPCSHQKQVPFPRFLYYKFCSFFNRSIKTAPCSAFPVQSTKKSTQGVGIQLL